jgi:long-chain acyl-CoA synthetase
MTVASLLGRIDLLLDRKLTLGRVMERLAAVHGDRQLAEEAAGERWTYRSASHQVDRWAGAIAARIRPGDRVVIALPANAYATFLLAVAAARAGAIAVPVNPQMTAAEVDHVVADSKARLVVRDPAGDLAGDDEPLARAVDAEPTDVAAIFYSSGTTGTPKGARLTHRAVVSQARAGAAWPSRLRRDEAVSALPVAHVMGFAVVLGLAMAGIPLYFLPRFRPDGVLDAIEGRRATMFVGVPAMYRLLLEAGAEERDLRSVRVWASGADVMPPELARRFQRLGASVTLPVVGASLGGALFVDGYGMVETGGGVAAKVMPPGIAGRIIATRADVLGVPLPGHRFKVVGDDGSQVAVGQVGELLVKGPTLLQGYHGDAAATRDVLTDDGWLRTGDLVRRGPFGLVAFAGRGKDVVKAGGFSVYALEVQRAIEQHEAVAEAAVVGVPDERMGERVVAAVRLVPAGAASEDELVAWCGERLASYKVPAEVRIVDDLPRTGTGKVRRDGVRALFAG